MLFTKRKHIVIKKLLALLVVFNFVATPLSAAAAHDDCGSSCPMHDVMKSNGIASSVEILHQVNIKHSSTMHKCEDMPREKMPACDEQQNDNLLKIQAEANFNFSLKKNMVSETISENIIDTEYSRENRPTENLSYTTALSEIRSVVLLI